MLQLWDILQLEKLFSEYFKIKCITKKMFQQQVGYGRLCLSSIENIPTVFRINKLKREDIFISCEDIFSNFPQLLSITEKVVCVWGGGGGEETIISI